MPINFYYCFVCEVCKDVNYINYRSLKLSIDYMRDNGWAVSKNRKKCYCQKCAINIRTTYPRGLMPKR